MGKVSGVPAGGGVTSGLVDIQVISFYLDTTKRGAASHRRIRDLVSFPDYHGI